MEPSPGPPRTEAVVRPDPTRDRRARHPDGDSASIGPETRRRTEPLVEWTRTAAAHLSDISMQGNYVNEQAEFGKEIALSAYGRSKYDRLAQLKARYDPANLFRLNQNIEPKP